MNDNDQRSAHIQRTIKRCALEVHPSGELRYLAREMGVTTKVFHRWWTNGRVPKVKADWLEMRFPSIVTAPTLIG